MPSKRGSLISLGIAAAFAFSACTSSGASTTEGPKSVDVLVNYHPMQQQLVYQAGKIISCLPPTPEPTVPVISIENPEPAYDWALQKTRLQVLDVNGRAAPVLTSNPISAIEMENIAAMYENPTGLETGVRWPNPEYPGPINTLVIDYRSTRTSLYEQQNGECELVSDDQPINDPHALFMRFNENIRVITKDEIKFSWNEMVISEADLPLTVDPNEGPQYLIDKYGKTINYNEIGKKAIQNGVTSVFVIAGPTAGMAESYDWVDPETKKRITIFGLNHAREDGVAIESFLHAVEHYLDVEEPYVNRLFTGRTDDYNFPYNVSDDELARYHATMSDQIYYARGFGSVHTPPNGLGHYDYNSPVRVHVPGEDKPVNNESWGGTQLGYYKWWGERTPEQLWRGYAWSLATHEFK